MSTGGDTYVYTGGTVEIPGLGIKLSVGADIVPQISPLTTPAGREERPATEAGSPSAKVADVAAQVIVPGYGSGKSAWEAYQSGNYWAAAGWGLLAVGEVGLTVATLGSSNW